jgi:hypothetical protein
MTAFETRWREMVVHPESPAFQRVDDSHPLDFYLGKETSGELLLLLITDERPKTTREYRAIHVIGRERNDGRWALLFRLMIPDLEKLFALVCEDLVESSRNIRDPELAATLVLQRFARWQRLLERVQTGLLDEEAIRGLMGELLFLERQAIPSKGVREAVNAWVGSAGAERDFRFTDNEYEIKAIRTGANSVLISSAEQLDLATKSLDLFIVVMDEAEPESHAEVFTPIELVNRLRTAMEADAVALESFESKLMEAGFVLREEYGERAYLFRHFRKFHVSEDFPAIRRRQLPNGIGTVVWELQIPAIVPFEVSPAVI